MIDFVATFIFFFAVIDPIGTVPVFIAVTNGYGAVGKRKVAFIAIAVSVSVLLFFVIAGEFILTTMGIPLSAFQIAGGMVLFLFAISMIFGESKPEEEIKIAEENHETAIFPLAIPSIAGPGAMLASVLMTDKARFTYWEQAQTFGVLCAVLLVTLLLMLVASGVHKIIGNAGASIISRVMGLILASVAVANTLAGLKNYFQI